jgi:hypothetical protein
MQGKKSDDRCVLFVPSDTRQEITLPLSSLMPFNCLGDGSFGVVLFISTDAFDLAA